MKTVLYDSTRHEALRPIPWDENRVRAAIEHIVVDTESSFTRDRYWPIHPRDESGEDDVGRITTPLYFGACGVFWALHYLQALGAVQLSRSYVDELDLLLSRNRAWLGDSGEKERASFLMGDTPIQLLAFGEESTEEIEQSLDSLIAGNLDHPARELMWGSPGTLLAALFLYERTGNTRWAELFRLTAAKLWAQLQWSPQHECFYWTQDLYGRQFTFLDAVHGFVATASPLIRGRRLLDTRAWKEWEQCIFNTVERTVRRVGAEANWPVLLRPPEGDSQRMLMQFCHGAPGFIICLAELPSTAFNDLLLSGGEATWSAGPLIKGSNLCHGTGGNGYAFLKLYRRTNETKWLERARAFAMHGIAQTDEDALRHGQLRYSLWTGDLGFAIYLWDCLHGKADFPTLDVFYANQSAVKKAVPCRNGQACDTQE